MSQSLTHAPPLPDRVCHRAVEARDPRFDGVFFVAITSTRIYCRPICPSRPADPDNRRFFRSAASAECAGFRPCLRCRPELAPGRAIIDAVSRLAVSAAERIAAGALNGRSVGSLASDLHVSERHLRRALKREMGISPTELAQSHRLRLAKRLLADTDLDIGRVAFASGFQSLRRFNAVVRERYRMTPSDLRRSARTGRGRGKASAPEGGGDPATGPVELTLSYRPPFAWRQVLRILDRRAIAGTECVADARYSRAVRIHDRSGVVLVEDDPDGRQLRVVVSPGLVLELMPLMARLRRLFDLDADPRVIDGHLAAAGLEPEVRARPGIRVPGPFDGFDGALAALLASSDGHPRHTGLAARIVRDLGTPVDDAVPPLDRTMPGPGAIAEAGAGALAALGVPPRRATLIACLARAVDQGTLRLDPDAEPGETRRALLEIDGIDPALARSITVRALCWPDTLDVSDAALQRAAGVRTADALLRKAEPWRPWRAYAAAHLEMRSGIEGRC